MSKRQTLCRISPWDAWERLDDEIQTEPHELHKNQNKSEKYNLKILKQTRKKNTKSYYLSTRNKDSHHLHGRQSLGDETTSEWSNHIHAFSFGSSPVGPGNNNPIHTRSTNSSLAFSHKKYSKNILLLLKNLQNLFNYNFILTKYSLIIHKFSFQ